MNQSNQDVNEAVKDALYRAVYLVVDNALYRATLMAEMSMR